MGDQRLFLGEHLFLIGIVTLQVLCSSNVQAQTYNQPPSIPRNFSGFFKVMENVAIGTKITTIQVEDPDPSDTLRFQTTTYTSDLVTLGTPYRGGDQLWSCDLFLASSLDRDNSPTTRTLYFSVSDPTTTITIKTVMIINDVNDNPPSFEHLPYKTSIKEDLEINQTVFMVKAKDPDLGSGGSVVYSIEAYQEADKQHYKDTFTIQQYNGNITLSAKLDYEERSFYHFKVFAKDEGNPPCPGPDCLCNVSQAVCEGGPVDLFITVEDVQDTPPVFDRLLPTYSVAEDSPVGFSILQVRAVDGDRGVATPNRVEYSFLEDTELFKVEKTSGKITVAGKLDATDPGTVGGLYQLSVVATEVAVTNEAEAIDPANRYSIANFSIIVTDVDDHAPQFNHTSYTASVVENMPSGAPIEVSPEIFAQDIDQGDNARFRVTVQKDGKQFDGFSTLPSRVIQGSSGVILTVANSALLDYETTHSITFQLVLEEVHSSGFGPAPPRQKVSANVVVNLVDANDESPRFPTNQKTDFSITEAANVGDTVGVITAEDDDSGDFGTVTFSFEEDDSIQDFKISENGTITVARPLDRETRSSYSLVVKATDSPGSLPSQRRSSRLPITVKVQDTNDERPTWTQIIPIVSVQESVAANTRLTDLIAIDRDEGLNGKIEYNIVPGTNGSSLFEVKTENGRAELLVKASLIGHSGEMLVKVKATDRGTPALRSLEDAEITVLVIDENQYSPVFTNPDQTQYNVSIDSLPELTVKEEQDIDSLLMTLTATDEDAGVNGEINFFLVPSLTKDFEYFTVGRETGELRNVRRLDKEKKGEFEIQLKAEDRGQPATRASTITLRVRLLDIDDHTPTFSGQKMPLKLTVEEGNPSATIGTVIATDEDSDPANNRICYYLYGGDYLSRVSVERSTGTLKLTSEMDREKTRSFDLVIKASPDCNLDPLSYIRQENLTQAEPVEINTPPAAYNESDTSLLWVRVTVTDINDNPPVFKNKHLTEGVLYDVPIETEIHNLANYVHDEDTPVNSKHQFRLKDIQPHLEDGDQDFDPARPPFVLSTNGSLVTNALFSSNQLGYYLLTVEVFDSLDQSDTAGIRIYLISNLQRVRLTFNKQPDAVERTKQDFVKLLSDILDINVVMDKVVSHTLEDGTRDGSRSDAFLHGWYRDTEEMVPAAELRSSLDFNQRVRQVLYEYGVQEAQTLEAKSSSDDDDITRLYVIIIVVMVVMVIVLILVLVHIIKMYRRRLRAATTMAYAAPKEQEMYEHPGTNKYFAAENPLFGKEIKHAVIDDDKTSHNSLDVNAVDVTTESKGQAIPLTILPASEEQEVVLQISDAGPRLSQSEKLVKRNSANANTKSSFNGGHSINNSISPNSRDPQLDNHIATLDHVLQAYSNSAFEDDEDENGSDNNDSNSEENENRYSSVAAIDKPRLTDTYPNVKTQNENGHRSNYNQHNLNNSGAESSDSARGPASLAHNNQDDESAARRPSSGVLYIPGLGGVVQEGVTRFSDGYSSRDSGYPTEGAHLDYTDI